MSSGIDTGVRTTSSLIGLYRGLLFAALLWWLAATFTSMSAFATASIPMKTPAPDNAQTYRKIETIRVRPQLPDRRFPERDKKLGWAAQPNSTMRQVFRHQGKPVFDVQYDFDSHGNRKVRRNEQASRFALLFGGSNIFGEGLPAADTVAEQLMQLMPDLQAYNLAWQGYGPGHLFVQAKYEDLKNYVREPEGIAVYLYFDFHYLRLVGGSQNFVYNKGLAPRLELADREKIVYAGSHKASSPLRFHLYRFVGANPLFRYFKSALPITATRADAELVCQTFIQSAAAIRRQKKLTRFILLYMRDETRFPAIDLQQCGFADAGIELVPLPGIGMRNPPMVFPDHHFNARGAGFVASELAKIIQKPRAHADSAAATR